MDDGEPDFLGEAKEVGHRDRPFEARSADRLGETDGHLTARESTNTKAGPTHTGNTSDASDPSDIIGATTANVAASEANWLA